MNDLLSGLLNSAFSAGRWECARLSSELRLRAKRTLVLNWLHSPLLCLLLYDKQFKRLRKQRFAEQTWDHTFVRSIIIFLFYYVILLLVIGDCCGFLSSKIFLFWKLKIMNHYEYFADMTKLVHVLLLNEMGKMTVIFCILNLYSRNYLWLQKPTCFSLIEFLKHCRFRDEYILVLSCVNMVF